MKKLLYFLLLGSVLSGCSNDFEVSAPWKEIPVAYAILSPRDTAHYIRIEKAYLDPNKSALEIAQIADSLYYPESAITVWLESDASHTRIQLHRVDGNLEGHVRDQGIFADQPNWLYKLKGIPLTPGGKYRLIIQRHDGKPDVTAETIIPKDFTIITPDPAQTPAEISFSFSQTTTVEWRADQNAAYFDIYLVVPYREETPDGMTLFRDTLVWKAASNVEKSNSVISGSDFFKNTVELEGTQFFRFLVDNIPPTPTNFRYFGRASVFIQGGGKEIKEFNLTALANSGLTGAEVYPIFTNLSEGYGIVTSKNEFKMNNIRISKLTIDSLNANPLTQGLKFRL